MERKPVIFIGYQSPGRQAGRRTGGWVGGVEVYN